MKKAVLEMSKPKKELIQAISIKTPKQLNSEPENLKQSIVVKQLGNVTITRNVLKKEMPVKDLIVTKNDKLSPHAKVKDALHAQLRLLTEKTRRTNTVKAKEIPTSSVKKSIIPSGSLNSSQGGHPTIQKIKPKWFTSVESRFIPVVESDHKKNPSSDSVSQMQIQKLQKQKRELCKTLINCRREMMQMQDKMQKMTDGINYILKNMCTTTVTPATSQKRLADSQLSEMQTTKKFMSAPLEKSEDENGNKFVRCPQMPIRNLETLHKFNRDLGNREFLELMVKRHSMAHSKVKVDNADSMLSYILHTIVSFDMLIHFGVIEKANRDVEVKSFPNFRLFYARVVNAAHSLTFLGRIMDLDQINNFLCSKILLQHKMRLQEQQRDKSRRQMETTSCKANTGRKNEKPEDQVDEEESELEEISNFDSSLFENNDDDENLVSICDEQDFEFTE